MSFLLASAARATTGARSGQEDSFRLWPTEGVAQATGEDGGLLAVLADGMGGHTGGAIAGQTACSMFTEVFASASSPYDERLRSALHASNEALAKGVEQNSGLRGMGCTLIAAWMDTLGIRWTSVGDSLLLLYRFPDVIRLNADHSLGSFLDEQARQNRISATEAKQHLNRNALRSALTGSKIDLIDLRSEPMELRPGDWILLASDGICSLEGDEIADVIYNFRQSKPEAMAEGLIDAVLKKGVAGQDNTTVVAVRVDQAPEAVSNLETTRVVMRRGDDEQELRSRRIGITGRKSIPQRRRAIRSVMWFMAAAVFFLFFAATVVFRSWQSISSPPPEAAIPVKPEPALAAPSEPATPDTPEPAAPGAPRPPAPGPPVQPAQPAPKSAMPIPKPVTPPAPKSAAPDVPQPAAPPVPAPQVQPAPRPQGAAPSNPPPTAPSDTQPTGPSPTPNTQSGEVQEERSQRTTKTKTRSEQEERRRARRREQQTKEGAKEVPKAAPKIVPRAGPKEAPAEAPREPAKPWGFGND